MDMDISMDIHAKICGYGYGYGWEISYPRQAWYSRTRALSLLTYLHSWFGRTKLAISPKRLKTERKLLLTAYMTSYTGFRLPSKCMTLNDL